MSKSGSIFRFNSLLVKKYNDDQILIFPVDSKTEQGGKTKRKYSR